MKAEITQYSKSLYQDFPSGPGYKLPMQGAGVQRLVRELDPHATTKSLHATAGRPPVPQLTPGTAK